MVLLGAVLEVNKFHVTFSLPFNLRGIVAISDVSDHITKLVKSETQDPERDDDGAEVRVESERERGGGNGMREVEGH